MSSAGDKVVARIPHGYNGKYRDRGEVYVLIEGRNNPLLEGHRYFLPFSTKEHKELSCDKGCGRFFASITFLETHYRKKDCNDDSAVPTKMEYAELIGADPDKFSFDESNKGSRDQVAKDLSNTVTE